MAWLQPGSHLKHYCLAVRVRFILLFLMIFIHLQKHYWLLQTFVEGTSQAVT